MPCPFCARDLTTEHDVGGGRYSCPDCTRDGSEIAKKGWLPAAKNPIRRDADNAARLTRDPTSWFAKSQKTGATIERVSTCECGTTFTQALLSARFLAAIEARSAKALELVRRQIPNYYVPVHCPRCERIDLGRQAAVSEHRSNFGERDEAAD